MACLDRTWPTTDSPESTQSDGSAQTQLARAFGDRLASAVTVATTEHFNLQIARAATRAEANRAHLPRGAVHHLIAVAFIGQMSRSARPSTLRTPVRAAESAQAHSWVRADRAAAVSGVREALSGGSGCARESAHEGGRGQVRGISGCQGGRRDHGLVALDGYEPDPANGIAVRHGFREQCYPSTRRDGEERRLHARARSLDERRRQPRVLACHEDSVVEGAVGLTRQYNDPLARRLCSSRIDGCTP
jgi:hypothetical protein